LAFYLIIRGPLGAGKTTVSAGVAKAVAGRHIFIDEILEKYDLEEWEEGYISERSFLRANEIAAGEAEFLLRRGTPVVFDGNFYHRRVLKDLEARLPFLHAVFTLRAPLSLCIARDCARTPTYGAEAAREVFEKTTSFDYGTVVDATGSVAEVVRTVLDHIRGRGLSESPTAA